MQCRYLVDEILKRCGDSHAFWIDLTDTVTENTFIWGDGTLATAENTDWGNNQPDNWSGADCSVVSRGMGYKFDDVPCEGSTNGVICERYIGE